MVDERDDPGEGAFAPSGDVLGARPAAPAPPPPVPTLDGPASRTRRRVVAGVAAAVVVLTAVLVAVLGGGQSAQAVVASAATSALNDKTATATVDASMDFGGTTVSYTGAGVIDFSQNAIEIQGTAAAAGTSTRLTVEYLGGTAYEQIPELEELLPGKSWVSLDLGPLAQSLPAGAAGPGAMGNPTAFLRLLASQGATVVELGPSTVDGTSVQGYAVTLDATAVENELKTAQLPAWMSQALSATQIGSLHIKVYVDGSGHVVSEEASNQDSVDGSAVSIDETTDFSNWGSPVSITAPPTDQVASLQDLEAAAVQARNGTSTP